MKLLLVSKLNITRMLNFMFTTKVKKSVMKPPVPGELCSSRYSIPGSNGGWGGRVGVVILFWLYLCLGEGGVCLFVCVC